MSAVTLPVPAGTMVRVSIRLPGSVGGKAAQVIWMNVDRMPIEAARDQIVAELLARLAKQMAQ